MPLEPPDLDSRGFEELFELARARIPGYTPEWTDFNDSDPGITLLQLFAWLTEQMLFEMNRVPDRTYLQVLKMLGIERRPAQPAVAHLAFVPDPDAAEFPSIEAGTPIGGQAPDGTTVVFETSEPFDLSRVPMVAVQVNDGGTFVDLTAVNESAGTPFRPLGWVPQPGNALYLGFSAATAAAPFPDELRLRAFLPPGALGRDTPPVTLVWEYAAAAEPTRWRALSTFLDETRGFTREGYLRIEGPDRPVPTAEGQIPEQLYWIRCRLAAGGYPASAAPEIDFVRCNTAPAVNLSTVRDELLGTSDGRPGQTFTFASSPVRPGSLELSVELAGASPQPWKLVDDFYRAGPGDAVAVLVAQTGELRFGDGEHGRIPPGRARIVAKVYQHGGGEAGNLGAGQISSPQTRLTGVAEVSNPRPATGGRDEQPAADVMASAPSLLRHRGVAVAAADFAALAAETGGVRRATAVPLAHPAHPGIEVPGAVTVVIVPQDGDMPPRPSPDLVDRVLEHLEPSRMITTELSVTGPDYQKVTVEAVVRADPSAAGGTVRKQVLEALGKHLDPAERKFGADLVPTMLYGVIQSVQAVRDVPSLTIEVAGRQREITEQIVAGPGALFYGADHRITVQPFSDR